MAEEQVMFRDYFPLHDRVYARMVCQVMAEVYMMDPRTSVKIAGEWLEADLVAEVFRAVEPEHVAEVVEKIKGGALEGVRNTRPYVRAMLYNEVYEADVRAAEEVREVWG